MADEHRDKNPAEVSGSGADEQSTPGGGSSAVEAAPPDTGQGDQMADAKNEYPDVMDMESLPTWKLLLMPVSSSKRSVRATDNISPRQVNGTGTVTTPGWRSSRMSTARKVDLR